MEYTNGSQKGQNIFIETQLEVRKDKIYLQRHNWKLGSTKYIYRVHNTHGSQKEQNIFIEYTHGSIEGTHNYVKYISNVY